LGQERSRSGKLVYELRATVEKLAAREAEFEASMAIESAAVRDLEGKVASLSALGAAFEHSRSWRITRPLRALGRFVRSARVRS
jgi:hypothetical protein